MLDVPFPTFTRSLLTGSLKFEKSYLRLFSKFFLRDYWLDWRYLELTKKPELCELLEEANMPFHAFDTNVSKLGLWIFNNVFAFFQNCFSWRQLDGFIVFGAHSKARISNRKISGKIGLIPLHTSQNRTFFDCLIWFEKFVLASFVKVVFSESSNSIATIQCSFNVPQYENLRRCRSVPF